jgi:hypothetical protein
MIAKGGVLVKWGCLANLSALLLGRAHSLFIFRHVCTNSKRLQQHGRGAITLSNTQSGNIPKNETEVGRHNWNILAVQRALKILLNFRQAFDHSLEVF